MLRRRQRAIRDGAQGGIAVEDAPGSHICRLRIGRFRTFQCSYCISAPVKSRLARRMGDKWLE